MKRYYFLSIFISLLFVGCSAPKKIAPPKTLTLTPIPYERIYFWEDLNHTQALISFYASCQTSNKASYLNKVCQTLPTFMSAKAFFETYFMPYVWQEPHQESLITGYFEPLLYGSRIPTSSYTIPLRGIPNDLLVIDPKEYGVDYSRARIDANGSLARYYERKDIIDMPVRSEDNIICYLDNHLDYFLLQVQGSGRIHLVDENRTINVGYGQKNGYAYTSIGKYMIQNNILPESNMSVESIKAWGQAHPQELQNVLNINKSFLFMIEREATATGAQGIELTAQHSVAIDTTILPFGLPMLINTTHPMHAAQQLHALAITQDKGAAIKGAQRVDFFWGYGQKAGALAGRTKSSGTLILLLPRHVNASKPIQK